MGELICKTLKENCKNLRGFYSYIISQLLFACYTLIKQKLMHYEYGCSVIKIILIEKACFTSKDEPINRIYIF